MRQDFEKLLTTTKAWTITLRPSWAYCSLSKRIFQSVSQASRDFGSHTNHLDFTQTD